MVTDRLQDMVDTNFRFYKRITDDREYLFVCRAVANMFAAYLDLGRATRP